MDTVYLIMTYIMPILGYHGELQLHNMNVTLRNKMLCAIFVRTDKYFEIQTAKTSESY